MNENTRQGVLDLFAENEWTIFGKFVDDVADSDRTINFGKYKGTPIKQLILEHIGYIYWCLDNLKWFKLNTEEQALYDALAIANIKYKIDLAFPVHDLSKHVSDKESLKRGITPFFISKDGIIKYHIQDENNPIIRGIIKYKDDNIHSSHLTASQMLAMCKYMQIPEEDESDFNAYMGIDPHSFLE